MPKFPSMINLTLLFASGLPNGASLFIWPYEYTKTLPSYKNRVDIGLEKVFIDQKDNKNRWFLEKMQRIIIRVHFQCFQYQ